jgi:hypothetical protein
MFHVPHLLYVPPFLYPLLIVAYFINLVIHVFGEHYKL